jgi:hypothetical protein
MDSQQIAILTSVLVLGPAVLTSYIPIFKDQTQKKYDYWLGAPKSTQIMFYIFWVIAAIGFMWYIISLFVFPITSNHGLFNYGVWIRPTLIGLLLLTSLGWSAFTWLHFHHNYSKVWTSICLILTAICTILILAGEVESKAPWHRILGLMGLATTVVLIDSVMWNALWMMPIKS